MKNLKKPSAENQKILKGLEMAYEKMVKFKRYKNSPLVVSENGKIIEIPPDEIPLTTTYYERGDADI